jgi:hypothetical protein
LPPELTQLIAAAKADFVHAIYALSQAADDPDNFDRLQRALHHVELIQIKNRELKLKEDAHALARERLAETKRQFNYNAGRAALIHNCELQKIMKNRKLDNEGKIWEASKVCFGEVPGDGAPPYQAPSTAYSLGHDNTQSVPPAPFQPPQSGLAAAA